MLVGLGICLAHRTSLTGKEQTDALVTVAREILDEPVQGSFSSSRKRELMGRFARAFFSPDDVEKHDGLPLSLVQTLSASTYLAKPLPRQPRRGRKKDPVVLPAENVRDDKTSPSALCCPA
jgi:hypothetical protein